MRRVWAVLWVLLVLIGPAARPATVSAADEVVVDDSGPGVEIKGTWAASTTSPGYVGDGYHYRVAGDGSSSVRWPLPGPAGTYEVFARWTSGDNRASNATYVISHAAGSTSRVVDQRGNGGAWQSLGTYQFAPGNGVLLTDKADGVVVADAVRFVPNTSGAAAAGSAAPAASTPVAPQASGDPRYYDATHFRVDRDAFWDFFGKRGGVRTFGYPVSREFTLFGCQTQIFQRAAMQQCGSQGVSTLNVLEDGYLPYTSFNNSHVPGIDPDLIAAAPAPSQPDYGTRAIEFVRANAPDEWQGEPVNFLGTFLGSVSANEAFPNGDGDPALLPLINLQLWGMPTSKPAVDPTNHEFIYQRFQRGVMHYDRGCHCTQGLLLADYLKAVLTGEHLPDDLAAQAANSPLLKAVPAGRALNATTFGDAFVAQAPAVAPQAAAVPASQPTSVSSPDFGMSLFLWGHPDTTNRDLKLVTDAGFRWQKSLFQWRAIEGACKGCFDWTEADRLVKASTAAGVRTIARLDFQPAWARKDGATNGPPDNYQDYADFVSAFVSRYGSNSSIGRVHAIEVWNEVNLDREWGGARIDKHQAAEYVDLLGRAYGAARAADPNVIVVTAGLSPTGVTNGHSADDVQYLGWLFEAGLKGGVNYDVLGAHGNTQAPEVDAALNSLPAFSHPSFYFRRVEQLREVQVKAGDSDRHVWLLEFGWTSDSVHPNYSWFAVSEDKKSTNIVKAFQYARDHWQPWIGVMTLWTLPDPSWTADREEYWWAITNADGTPRPAYTELLQARRNGLLPLS